MTATDAWRADAPNLLASACRRADTWLASPALAQVLSAFGVPDLPREVEVLAAWSATVLDTRVGRERQLVDPVDWSDRQVTALLDAALQLGLVETAAPSAPRYDHTIVMAGTTTANRLRTELAAATGNAGVELGTVVGLASQRPIPDWEQARHHDVAHDVEWADLAAVLTSRFGVGHPSAATGAGSDPVLPRTPTGSVRLTTAPNDATGRRPDSAAALDHLVARVSSELGRTLLVTSAIYAPYTFFVAAARLAAAATSVEVIGTRTSTADAGPALAQRFAQEIHATLESIRSLLHPYGERL